MARNDSAVEATSLSEPFFQRIAEALPISMTACVDPFGMVATKRAFLGISVWVD